MNILAQRFQTTLELFATGVALKRQALKREHPEMSARQIEESLNRWLAARPGAEFGDGPQPQSRD